MPLCALPDHWKKKNSIAEGSGKDWDNWLQAYIPQHWFAFGKRCSNDEWDVIPLFLIPIKFKKIEKFPWFQISGWFPVPFPIPVKAKWRETPVLLLGYGVTRWMNSGDKDVLFIPSLHGKWSGKLAFWGRNEKFQVTHMGPKEQVPDFMETLDGYGPSPIQYWSPKGFALTWPLHLSVWYQKERIENPNPTRETYKKTYFARALARWDSFDEYFDCPSAFVGGTFN